MWVVGFLTRELSSVCSILIRLSVAHLLGGGGEGGGGGGGEGSGDGLAGTIAGGLIGALIVVLLVVITVFFIYLVW